MKQDDIVNEIEVADPFHSPAKTVVAVIVAIGLFVAAGVGGWMFMQRAAIAKEDAATAQCLVSEDASGVDWADVHASRWPTVWIDVESRPAARAALLEALQNDRDAVALASALLDARGPTPLDEDLGREHINAVLNAEREAVRAWNRHMRERGVPWRLRLPLSPRLRRGYPIAMSDCVMHTGQLTVNGEHQVDVLALSRVDTLNVVENYADVAAPVDGEVHVLLERTESWAIDHVWPSIAPPDDESPTFVRHMQPGLAEALRGGLSPRAHHVLQSTADARRTLMRFKNRSVERLACGGGLRVADVPIRGFDDALLSDFRAIATPDYRGGCPNVTIEELAKVRAASALLRRARGLRPALDELMGFIVRNSATGGALYAVDAGAYDATACSGCDGLNDYTTTSLRWMLIELANTEAPELALWNACHLRSEGHHRGRAARAMVFAALRWRIDPCAGDLPDAEGGRTLEAELFGSSTVVEWSLLMPDAMRPRTR